MKRLPRLRLMATCLHTSAGTLALSSPTAFPTETPAKPGDTILSGETSALVPSRKPIPTLSQITQHHVSSPHIIHISPVPSSSILSTGPLSPSPPTRAEGWKQREGRSGGISFPGNGLPGQVPGNLLLLLFAVVEVLRNKSPSSSCFAFFLTHLDKQAVPQPR